MWSFYPHWGQRNQHQPVVPSRLKWWSGLKSCQCACAVVIVHMTVNLAAAVVRTARPYTVREYGFCEHVEATCGMYDWISSLMAVLSAYKCLISRVLANMEGTSKQVVKCCNARSMRVSHGESKVVGLSADDNTLSPRVYITTYPDDMSRFTNISAMKANSAILSWEAFKNCCQIRSTLPVGTTCCLWPSPRLALVPAFKLLSLYTSNTTSVRIAFWRYGATCLSKNLLAYAAYVMLLPGFVICTVAAPSTMTHCTGGWTVVLVFWGGRRHVNRSDLSDLVPCFNSSDW